MQAGVAWPTPRFTDNSDGTVTDNLTGLIWLKDATCPGTTTWQAALDWVADLNDIGMAITCTNYAANTFTDWRLPNVKELLSLVDYGQSNPALPSGHPFVNIAANQYWSSTNYLPDPTGVYQLNIFDGVLLWFDPKIAVRGVWPVRGGQ